MTAPTEPHIMRTIVAIPAINYRDLLAAMLQVIVQREGSAAACRMFPLVGENWCEPQSYGWPPQ
jgi:hypothetical protein